MRGNDFLDKMELIDPAYVEAADDKPKKKKSVWLKWGAMAACLCLVAAGVFGLFKGGQSNTIQNWNGGYEAKEYFKFCDSDENGSSSTTSLDTSAIPYAESRYFSDMRSELEKNRIIPTIESHPQFTFAARYNDDGSLYCVELLWGRRSIGDLNEYSGLEVIAGYEEVPIITDCIAVEVDDNGNILEPAVTITERDGVKIVARGRENTEKTLTFQTENGWYQISGSWNDSYEPVVELLDWFWDNPINFEEFPMNAGDEYTYTSLAEMPEAFSDYLPDFSSFGFVEETTSISLKNGVPVHFEGYYVAHVSEDLVKAQDYYDVEGYTKICWCILAEPDVYDLEGCLGDINTITKEQITHILENEDNKIKFMQNDLLIIVYPGDTTEAWEIIESLIAK